ncbi:MAG: hypothetical protein SF162_02980 [bacterium]|nr:hypothetical protein [bacterium]
MPFQDDSGLVREDRPHPLVAPFAAFAAQVERVVLVNVGWSLQLIPALVAFAFDLPPLARTALTLYTVLALIPATGWLYQMARHAADHDHLSPEVAREALERMFLPSFRVLLPLFGSMGLLFAVSAWAEAGGLFGIAVAARLAILLYGTTMLWWGVLHAQYPTWSAVRVALEAARMVWRDPAPSLLPIGATAISLLIGVISIGGIFLAVPILIALLGTTMADYLKAQVHS